uniref:Uncharacterized protein n=1 Tax=Candidatus Kentrum sp. LFY TaxID=2126342 RepID=A0A450UI50_9GAMM|nr:MAG: hypothetical protein BECKLFY1418B_GA0070995_103215 [Candidatus Kentron sp. LFY]
MANANNRLAGYWKVDGMIFGFASMLAARQTRTARNISRYTDSFRQCPSRQFRQFDGNEHGRLVEITPRPRFVLIEDAHHVVFCGLGIRQYGRPCPISD